MNKKFSTLLVSALLAGAAGVNAQTAVTTALSSADLNKVYYLGSGVTLTNGTYIFGKMSGDVNSNAPVPDYTNEAYAQWVLVDGGVGNGGTQMFKLRNLATGRYYMNNNNQPVLFSSSDLTGTSTPKLFQIDAKVLDAAYLNNQDSYDGGFSLNFLDGNHKNAYSFIDNPFAGRNIYAHDVKAVFPNTTYAGGLLLQVAGDWSGADLYTEEARINSSTNQVYKVINYDADQVKKFRASTFIVLDDNVYSQFETNVIGTKAGTGYKFTTVTGAEFMGKVFSVKDDVPNSGVTSGNGDASQSHNLVELVDNASLSANGWATSYTTVGTSNNIPVFTQSAAELTTSAARIYANAVFKIKRLGTTAATHVNDLEISMVDPYMYKTVDGKRTYTHAYTDDNTNSVSKVVYVNVFDFEGQKYVCANEAVNDTYTHPSFVNVSMVGVTVDPQKFLASKKIVNVVYNAPASVKGMTWNPKDGTSLLAKFVDNTKPEGQWIVTYEEDVNKFTFTNLESKVAKGPYTLYDNGNNNYTAVDATGELSVTLTDAVKPNNMYGYADFTTEQLEQGFNISVITDLLGNVYLKEDHATDHKATFSQDVENASVWRMVKYNKAKDYANGIEGSDTIRIINDYTVWNPVYQIFQNKKDTVEAIAYSIYNDFTGEYLYYNDTQKAYYAKTIASNKLRSEAPKFVFKKKAVNDKEGVNIIPAKIQNDRNTLSAWENVKLIGSFSENKLTQEIEKYRVIDNDLFAIEPVAAPVYRTMDALSVVKIFKDSNNSDVLYEQGHFLGMEHVADVPDMKAAMLVDTAYVRYNTAKPSYLLAVGAEQVIDETICEIPGHPVHHADTVFGRFLVNMKDSMDIVKDKTPHNNPYMWETYPKLAFIEGYHTHDVLTLTGWDNKKIDLSKNADNYGVYRFRYVDREAGSFIMETKGGWIKWLNGTPVVVDKIELAEVLNLEATEEAPTANEAVAASEVSVVAVNGAIIVKGAAGKVVTVANILGQTIANQVAASDNVTIAAPAGIAVVTVDGEATKVVVK